MLADEGTVILKFFLHISKDEQAARLQARLDDPTKQLEVPARRPRGAQATGTTTRPPTRRRSGGPRHHDAPWYVVPADRKWYRNLVICRALVERLEGLDLAYPPSPDDLSGVVIE